MSTIFLDTAQILLIQLNGVDLITSFFGIDFVAAAGDVGVVVAGCDAISSTEIFAPSSKTFSNFKHLKNV